VPGYIPPRNYHPTTPGDSGAVRNYASKLRAAAKSLQSISDDADTQVWFYTDGQSWGDQFKTMWSEQITASDQLNASAYAQDRANFVKANPRLARLYDANSSQSPGAFRNLIDACNQMADSLDQYAHSIDQEIAQEWDIFLDIVIIAASIIVTAVSFGALGPEAAILDIAVVGATIGGFTSMAIDFSNQMVTNIVINHDGFGAALGNINMQELQDAFITGYIVGGVSSVIGIGLPAVFNAAGGVFKAAVSNTIVRIGVEAVGFGVGTFAGDLAAQQVVSLNDNLRLTAPDWGSAAKDSIFATAGGVVFGGLMHGLGLGRAPDVTGAGDPTSQQWGIGVTTLDENGGKISFFALSDPKGGPDLTLFEGSPTSTATEIGPARLIDGTTLMTNDGSVSLDLTKPGTDMLLQTGRSSSWITVDPNGSPRFVAESAISDGSIKFTVTPGDRGVPTDLNFDPNTGEMQVPKDWKVTADYNAGRVTVTAPWSSDASYTFSLRDPGAQGWGGMDPKMIAGPANGTGGDPNGAGIHPNATTGDSSPELSVQTLDRPATVVDGTVVDGTIADPNAGPPIDPSTGSGGPQSSGLRLEPAPTEQPLRPVASAIPPEQVGGDPAQKLLGPGPGGSVDPRALSPEEAAQAQRIWDLRQGDIQGVAIQSEPGIDGTRNGQFISLKSVEGGLGGVARNVGRAEMQAARIGLRGVDVYVEAPNVGSAELLDFGRQGVIPRIIDNGVVSSVWVRTRDGWVVFPGRVDAQPPAPPITGGDPAPPVQPAQQPGPLLGGEGRPLPHQDEIVQGLSQIEGLKPEVWSTLDTGQRVNVLQGVEDTIAGIQGRTPERVVLEQLPPGTNARFDPVTHTIQIGVDRLGSADEESILGTFLHEDRHAYQFFAVENPGFHPDANEVAAWRHNYWNYQESSTTDVTQYQRYWSQPIEVDARSAEPIAGMVVDAVTPTQPLPDLSGQPTQPLIDITKEPTQPLPDISRQPTQPLSPDVSQRPTQPATAVPPDKAGDDPAELARVRAALLHVLQQHGLDLADPRVSAYRAQGRPLLHVDDQGNVTIEEARGRQRQGVSIHVGFDAARARFWLTDMGRDTVVEFQVRQSFLDRLRASAEDENIPNRSRENPWRVDLHTRGQVWADQYAIPPSWFDDLRASIVPGSGKVWKLSDLLPAGGPLQPDAPAGGAVGSSSPPASPASAVPPAGDGPQARFLVQDRPVEIAANPFDDQPSSSYELGLLRAQYTAEAAQSLREFHAGERDALLERFGSWLARAPVEQVPALRAQQAREWAQLAEAQRNDWLTWGGRPTTEAAEAAARQSALDLAASRGASPAATEVAAGVDVVGAPAVDASGNRTGGGYGLPVKFDVVVHPAGARTPARTEIVLRLSWMPDANVSADDIARVELETLQSMDHYFNAPHYTLPDGSVLEVRVQFTVGGDPRLYSPVRLRAGSERQTQDAWSVDQFFWSRAHEAGHWLGLRDEYFDPQHLTMGRETATSPGVFRDGSLYGDLVGGPMSLKPRHLEQIAALIAAAGHPVPEAELGDGPVRYRTDPEAGRAHLPAAGMELQRLMDISDGVLAGRVPVSTDQLAVGRARVAEAANIVRVLLDRGDPALPADVAAARQRLADVGPMLERLRGLEAWRRQQELGGLLRSAGAATLVQQHEASISDLARQVAAARGAVTQAVLEQRAPAVIGSLLRDLDVAVTALDRSLAAAEGVAGGLRAHGEEVARQLRTLAELGVPREGLLPGLRAAVDEAIAGEGATRLDQVVNHFDVELTTSGKLLKDLGVSPGAAAEVAVLQPTGDLAPAMAVVRDQLTGEAIASSKILMERVLEVDRALHLLEVEPGATEAAARALEALRASVVHIESTLQALDVGRSRLLAEVGLARTLPPEQRPAELPAAEALASNRVWEALRSTLDSGRSLLAAGHLRLQAEGPAPLAQTHVAVEPEKGGMRTTPAAQQPEQRAPAAPQQAGPVNLITADTFPKFSRDLADLVKIEADLRGTAPRDELQQWAIQRVLARFFTENPDDWVLKGGQSMLARYAGGRASTDLDFTRITVAEPDSMVADYERALQRDLGDYLTFVRESRTPLLHGAGVRLTHVVSFGGRELMRIGVDLAPPRTRPVWQDAQVVPFPERAIGTGAPGERPNLRVISLADTLAHKVSGMFTYGRRTIETKCEECLPMNNGMFMCKEGDLPTRAQDLADVLIIALSTPWDGPSTHAMLREEFGWRLEQGENLRVPDQFKVPNPAWGRSFARYAATTPGLPYKSVNEAVALARAFLDPLLAPEAPAAHWDPHQRLWIPNSEAPAGGVAVSRPDVLPQPGPGGPSPVQRLEATGRAPASTALAEPEMMARWKALAGDRGAPGSLDALLADVKARATVTLGAKIRYVRERIMAPAGYEPTHVGGLDSKNLRVYVHQRGELFIHAAALTADPETTIEIAYQPDRAFQTYRWEAHEAYVAYLDAPPAGMSAQQANAVAYWRLVSGRPIHGVAPEEMVSDLIDLHAQPLRDALKIRQRLIDDYHVEPGRIRLVYADAQQEVHYQNTRWVRAHLFALKAVREDPVAARRAIVDAIRGPGEAGQARQVRAAAVAERLFAANELPEAPRKYALLWIRDSRDQPVGGRHGPHLDTRPEMVRQVIEALRESHPDRQVVLLGDDLFARRPELRAEWERDGVLAGVDAETLVNFWAPERNGGRLLSLGEQALFFQHLTAVRDVVQIGMESGALELPAVLGTPTVYLEALEHDGNKGNRWALYREGWAFGHSEQLLDGAGRLLFDESARALTTFQVGDQFPAPLSTVERVLYGPDLPDPTNRRGQAMAVYLPAKVGVTSDRIIRLVGSGELDHWAARLGRSVAHDGVHWEDWNEHDWARSQYYAGQLNRWLRTPVATPEAAGQKWDGIRLALMGVIEPRFTHDETYEGAAIVHPYFELHTEHPVLPGEEARVAAAYDTDLAARPAAVTSVLKELLGGADLRRQAVDDLRLFRLEPPEIQALRVAIDRVTGGGPGQTGGPGPAPGGPAGGGPAGSHQPAAPGPYADRLDAPIVPGGSTPREVLARLDPALAGLPDVTAREAAGYIARNAARRPWLALAAGSDPLVQRVVVAVDRGQAHFLERHGPFADAERLQRRVTRLEDPAQLDAGKRAAGIDAYLPGEAVHRSPDIATAFADVDAFAVALARAIERPEVLAALRTPFEVGRRPDRVSLPIAALLGPDGHRYVIGYRLQPVGGSAEAAVEQRAAWVAARRFGGPDEGAPQSLPIETFEGGTVELFFQPNAANDGYEIATMFVDPPAPGSDGQ
jgi:hypothetical protein